MLKDGHIVLFLIERGLGFVNLLAFISFAAQWRGLISSRGLSPLRDFHKKVLLACWGSSADKNRTWKEWMAVFCTVPSLTWFCASDWFIVFLIYSGILSCVLVIFNFYAKLSLLICAIFYLSLKAVSEPFLSLQMDGNLIELDFILSLGALYEPVFPFIQILTLRFHIFRIMVACGLVKLFGSQCWRDLTAMCYHYCTQPLLNPLSAHFHVLPVWFHKFCTLMTFITELLVPLLYFGPYSARLLALFASLGLLAMINISGNYGFLGIMTAIVSLSLTEDSSWNFLMTSSAKIQPDLSIIQHVFAVMGLLLIIIYNFVCFAPLIQSSKYINPPKVLNKCHQYLKPFRISNYYGKFGSMRTERYELIVFATSDGQNWIEIDFKYKPGKVDRPPRWIAPGHLPRLDWRTWFLPSLASRNHEPPEWWTNLLIGILASNADILSLLDMSSYPFEMGKPPTKIRTAVFKYSLLPPPVSDIRQDGKCEKSGPVVYWKREFISYFGNELTHEKNT